LHAQYSVVDLIVSQFRRLWWYWLVVIIRNIYAITVQENMTRMLMVTDVQDIIKRHQAQIITSLKDPDIRLHVLSYMLTSLILYISSLNHLHSERSVYLLVKHMFSCIYMYKVVQLNIGCPFIDSLSLHSC